MSDTKINTRQMKLSGNASEYLDGTGAFSTPSAGATITGSAGQVAVCDGSGNAAGSANLTYDGFMNITAPTSAPGGLSLFDEGATQWVAMYSNGTTNKSVSILTNTGGSAIGMTFSNYNGVSIFSANGVVNIGDVNSDNNVTQGRFDDANKLIQFGNIDYPGDCVFAIDTANTKTTSNVKHETSGDITITDSAKGLVLKDTSGTPHYWRISVSTLGVLTTTDLGTSPP